MREGHGDATRPSAIEGSGIAVGKRPHLVDHLRCGELVAPPGPAGVAFLGGFFIVVSRDADSNLVEWLHGEAAAEMKMTPGPAPRRACSTSDTAS